MISLAAAVAIFGAWGILLLMIHGASREISRANQAKQRKRTEAYRKHGVTSDSCNPKKTKD